MEALLIMILPVISWIVDTVEQWLKLSQSKIMTQYWTKVNLCVDQNAFQLIYTLQIFIKIEAIHL